MVVVGSTAIGEIVEASTEAISTVVEGLTVIGRIVEEGSIESEGLGKVGLGVGLGVDKTQFCRWRIMLSFLGKGAPQ